MQALMLPASRGWQWLVEGFRLYRKNPPLLSLLTMGYWLTVLVLNSLPVIGPLLGSIAMPVLSVGMMAACQAISRGEPVDALSIYSAFRLPQRRTLFVLGGLYLLCSLVALSLSAVVDDGVLLDMMLKGKGLDDEALERGDYLPGMQFMMLIMLPAMMAWWYAPILAAWHNFGVGKSLFFSFVACQRNWRPFMLYGLAVMFYGAVLPFVALLVLGIILPMLKPLLLTILMVPMMLVFAPTLFASFYVSYREVLVVSTDA